MKFQILSDAFKNNESIPAKYTCDGVNISPPLKWESAPAGTKSFVLIVDDPDAPGRVWVHWVLFNIPASVSGCREGEAPRDALQGTNDFGHANYGGPCPPHGTHRYFFKLYALDRMLTVQAGAAKKDVEQAMQPHILGETHIIGTYIRS